MAYKVNRTDSFRRDLDMVVNYIALSLANRIAAGSLLDTIDKTIDELEYMPYMYEACHAPHLKKSGYRKVSIHNYIMLYTVDEEAKTVNIMRFFYGRRDYENQL